MDSILVFLKHCFQSYTQTMTHGQHSQLEPEMRGETDEELLANRKFLESV